MDRPERYGLTRKPVPYPAGIAIWAAFALLALPWVLWSQPLYTKEILGVLLAGTLLCSVSAVDDRLHIPAWIRLCVQALVGLILVLSGIGIETVTSPFGGIIDLQLWQIPFSLGGITYHLTPLADLFTILWVMVVINAVNFLDGIPGLVTGVGSIASATLLALSLLLIASPLTTLLEKNDAQTVAGLAALLLGVLVIAHRFDFVPPKVIIGDAGAMSVGFLLAVFSIFAGGKVATSLIVLALPLLDMLWVILRRLSKGQSPLSADHNHYHHKLLRLGLSERATAYLIYGITTFLGIMSLVLLFWYRSSGKYVAMLLVLLLIFGTSILLIRKETKDARGF